MRRLKHDRPIAFFDLETTGVSPLHDRIVEISVMRFEAGAREPIAKTRRLNPGRPIPAEASAIHGIRDADVANEPAFPQVARSLATFLEGCDLSGFNILRFDLPMLVEEFARADVAFDLEGRRFLDVQRMFHKLEPRDLTAAVKRYLGEDHVDAHGAEADVRATFRVLDGMLKNHPTLPRDVGSLQEQFNPRAPDRIDASGKLARREGEVVITFGKHAGTSLTELARSNRDYLEWVLKGDFSVEVKRYVQQVMDEVPTAQDETE